MWHGKGDVLPFAVGQDVCRSAIYCSVNFMLQAFDLQLRQKKWEWVQSANAHSAGATGEHVLNGESGPLADAVAVFFEIAVPAVINGGILLIKFGNHRPRRLGFQPVRMSGAGVPAVTVPS